mmetsp:Transcript_16265/g.37527  ORF Transcript_16265/g.37527 Transcript_16265/m.37527 type:complete len:146 (+) Transcript_16265:73-510(+)
MVAVSANFKTPWSKISASMAKDTASTTTRTTSKFTVSVPVRTRSSSCSKALCRHHTRRHHCIRCFGNDAHPCSSERSNGLSQEELDDLCVTESDVTDDEDECCDTDMIEPTSSTCSSASSAASSLSESQPRPTQYIKKTYIKVIL